MTKKSTVERLASSLPVNAAANAVAAFGATVTPLAAFVPFLVQSLASGRQAERLEKMFTELNLVIQEHSDQIRTLTDDQYKLVNEAIAAAFYTIDEQKLDLLKNAVVATINSPDVVLSISSRCALSCNTRHFC